MEFPSGVEIFGYKTIELTNVCSVEVSSLIHGTNRKSPYSGRGVIEI